MYTREKTQSWICGLAFQSGEKKRGPFFSHADWNFIWDRISIRKCAVYRRKWLGHVAPPSKSQFRGQGIHTAIWEMHHWKTPPDHHLNCAIQITHHDANLHVHTVQNTVIREMRNSNDDSNCALCSRVETQNAHDCIENWNFVHLWWILKALFINNVSAFRFWAASLYMLHVSVSLTRCRNESPEKKMHF